VLEQDANDYLNIFRLLPCVDYMLLKPRHVSTVKDHVLEVYYIKENFKIHIYIYIYISCRYCNSVDYGVSCELPVQYFT
jgi:hypothetical protein